MTRALWKISSFTTSFILAASLVAASAEWALLRAGIGRIDTCVSLMDAVTTWRQSTSRDYGHERIAVLGDSQLLAPPNQLSLPIAIQTALRRERRSMAHAKVHPLAWPAIGISGHYALADAVVHANPDRIVLEVNLQLLGPESPSIASFPELAGLVEARRLWEAAWLPMSYTGVTLNRLLFYRLLMVTGLHDVWAALAEEQGRIFKLREPFEEWLENRGEAAGPDAVVAWRVPVRVAHVRRVFVGGLPPRDTREHARSELGNLLDGLQPSQPRLQVLRALLDDYRRAGIPTLVWLTPLNTDHLRSLGFSLDGVDRSVAVLRAIVEGSGATFLDLHAGFPDSVFLDSGDHFTTTGEVNVSRILASKLAPAIAKLRPR